MRGDDSVPFHMTLTAEMAFGPPLRVFKEIRRRPMMDFRTVQRPAALARYDVVLCYEWYAGVIQMLDVAVGQIGAPPAAIQVVGFVLYRAAGAPHLPERDNFAALGALVSVPRSLVPGQVKGGCCVEFNPNRKRGGSTGLDRRTGCRLHVGCLLLVCVGCGCLKRRAVANGGPQCVAITLHDGFPEHAACHVVHGRHVGAVVGRELAGYVVDLVERTELVGVHPLDALDVLDDEAAIGTDPTRVAVAVVREADTDAAALLDAAHVAGSACCHPALSEMLLLLLTYLPPPL